MLQEALAAYPEIIAGPTTAGRLLYVAMTRARDHLVLGCHHRAKGQTSHAKRLWPLLTGVAAMLGPTAEPGAKQTQPPYPDANRAAFLARHSAVLAAAHRRVATSATGLVDATGADIDTLAASAAAEHGVERLTTDIAARARSVLAVPIVRAAVHGGRHWREVTAVVPDDGRILEGYIDLLVETPGGELAIVDYKADRATSDTEAAAKADHYFPQLAAYARAIEAATARPVLAAYLIFAAAHGARQVRIPLDTSVGAAPAGPNTYSKPMLDRGTEMGGVRDGVPTV